MADRKMADRKMADRKMADRKIENGSGLLYFSVTHFSVSHFSVRSASADLVLPLPPNLQLLTRILRFIAPRITARQFAISRAVVNNAIRGRVVIEHHADAVVTIQTGVTEHKFAFGQSLIQTRIQIIVPDPPPGVARKPHRRAFRRLSQNHQGLRNELR